MAKKEADHIYVVILAIVAVVAVVTLVLNGGLQGALIGNPITLPEESRISKCFDFDEANDRYTYGYTQVGVLKYYDYCKGNDVVQHYCEDGLNVVKLRPMVCSNGCQSGQCLR